MQRHSDFLEPVKHAYLLCISKTGLIKSSPSDGSGVDPDAYFYDVNNQVLIFVEVKIGVGDLYQDQLDSHKRTAPHVPMKLWNEGRISWPEIKAFWRNLPIRIIK